MERNFISDVTFDLATWQELNDHMRPLWQRWLLRLLVVLIGIWVLWTAVSAPELLKFCCGAFLIAAGISYLRVKDGGPKFQKLLEENGGQPKRNMLRITDAGIHYWNPETGNSGDLPFSEVQSITRTKRLLVLGMADGSTRLVNHSNVTGGTADELEAFLLEKCGVKRIVKRGDDRICRKALVCVMAAGFLWSFFGIYNGFTPEPKVMTYHEAAEVLEELGIDAPEEDVLNELEEYGASVWSVTELLYYAGAGEYDFDTWAWTPAESGVYTFDVEVFELSAMYTNFLRGVAAMSGGALEFTDIIEDDSSVDWDSGTGFKTVTFTYDEKQYILRPTMMNDWFDVEFANDLADIIGKDENGRRLYFLYDDYQMVSVFWCDADWAKEFAKETGYALTTRLS